MWARSGGVSIYVAPTRAEAQAKFDALQAFIDPAHSVGTFKTFLGWDLTGHDLDGPPPVPQPTRQPRIELPHWQQPRATPWPAPIRSTG